MGVAVQAASLVPLGQAVGIQMTTAGVLVADLAEVDTPGGTCTPAKDAGLRPGDVICRMDGLEICHLGDLGEECSSALIETLLPVHVLLIPVGGNYTIDAEQAKEYVDRIMPAIVIPMHYKTKGLNIDVDKVDDFADKFDTEEVEELEESELELFRDDISEESTKVIIMEREK